ncbi:MAG: TonB-linked SusC/RagA family outer membrane protein [Saprospiraceae bacterium]|jgi:TonB-linked SusC/RagA family outer membrane protein
MKIILNNQKNHLRYLLMLGILFQMCFSTNIMATESLNSIESEKIIKAITGKVVDVDGVALIGVNILVQGTINGTISDIDGSFTLDANPGDVLVFTYVGFSEQLLTIGDDASYNVTMQIDGLVMDEIVVIGYGTQKKSHLTGAISRVSADDLAQLPVSRVDDALVGRVSGVNIASTEGEAGSAPTIRIRGTGSMVASSDPLIVVDGLIVDNDFLGSLDMNDVESFEVLKDAASSAIYGSRGGNGVILVTTKNGKDGKTKFSYNGYFGNKEARQSDAYYFSVADGAAAELAANGEISERTRYKQLIGVDRDWQDVIFDGGNITGHSFSARGGNKKSNFSATFGYLHDEGVLLTDDFKKYNLNLKINTQLSDKLSFGASIAPSYTNRRRFDGSTHDILRQTPWLPVYHDENTIKFVDRNVYPDVVVGDYAIQRHFDNYSGDGFNEQDISNTSNTNPAAKVLERDRNDYKFKLYGSTFLQYKIMDGLKFKTVLSGDFQNTERDRWQGVQSNRNGASAASLFLSTQNRIHLVNENYLMYDKEIGKHEINSVLGFSAEKYDTKASSVSGSGYDSDLIQTISAATLISGATSTEYQSRFLSVFGRVNYAYDYKYLASASFRRDGSSVFGPESKYGVFPAISVGWVASQESFLKESSVIDYLKLRMSYGFTGNNRLSTNDNLIDNYPYIALLNASTAVVDGSVVTGFNGINIANPGLKWERSKEINPGIDFTLFNNFLQGSVDYYKRTSDQLLLYNPISSTTGFSEALINRGEVENSGIELELTTNNIRTADFRWSTSFIASKNKNELVDFADSDGQIQNVDSKRAAEWINATGNPISSFYGWVVDKDIPTEFLKEPFHPIGAQAQDVYVKDLNGDGLIDDDDKTILGNPYPDLVWSLNNDFSYKGLDIGIMIQGSHGAEVRNMGDQYIFNQFNSGQDFISETPDQEFIKQKIFTDDIIQDASYLSLRNVTIGYNFDKGMFSGAFSKARIYVSGQNLMYKTADDYTGFNPESINTTSATTYGYQRAGSPIQRTISVGVNLEF